MKPNQWKYVIFLLDELKKVDNNAKVIDVKDLPIKTNIKYLILKNKAYPLSFFNGSTRSSNLFNKLMEELTKLGY